MDLRAFAQRVKAGDHEVRIIGSKTVSLRPRFWCSRLLDRIGVPEGIRTPDLRFRKPLLYPAELPGQALRASRLCVFMRV